MKSLDNLNAVLGSRLLKETEKNKLVQLATSELSSSYRQILAYDKSPPPEIINKALDPDQSPSPSRKSILPLLSLDLSVRRSSSPEVVTLDNSPSPETKLGWKKSPSLSPSPERKLGWKKSPSLSPSPPPERKSRWNTSPPRPEETHTMVPPGVARIQSNSDPKQDATFKRPSTVPTEAPSSSVELAHSWAQHLEMQQALKAKQQKETQQKETQLQMKAAQVQNQMRKQTLPTFPRAAALSMPPKKPVKAVTGITGKMGGKSLKTGVVPKAAKKAAAPNNPHDPMASYMNEVRKYAEKNCETSGVAKPGGLGR